MSAQLIKGMPIANEVRDEIRRDVRKLAEKGIAPTLALILLGDDKASVVSARSKETVAQKLGIKVNLTVKPADASEDMIRGILTEFSEQDSINGILMEVPAPRHINRQLMMSHADPRKDVDGVHPLNRAKLLAGDEDSALIPAAALACMELLSRVGVKLDGKKVALVGRGQNLGKPLISLLLNRNATVFVCHTKTTDIPAITRLADIVISAAGRPNLITAEYLSEGQIVIDAGISAKEGGGITGDVDFSAAESIVDRITPVPGGVGSLTTTILMQNLIKAIKLKGKF